MIAKQGHGRAEEVQQVVREVERRVQPVLESFARLIAMKEVGVTVNGSRPKQTSGVKPEVYSELARILGNWADHQRPAVVTDTNEPPLNVNQAVPVTPQRNPGGAENPSETKSLEDLEAALQAERAAEPGRPDLAGRFSDLGLEYLSAYQRIGRIETLNGAIRNAKLAMEVAPAEAPPDLASMTNLSRWYGLKFGRTEEKI